MLAEHPSFSKYHHSNVQEMSIDTRQQKTDIQNKYVITEKICMSGLLCNVYYDDRIFEVKNTDKRPNTCMGILQFLTSNLDPLFQPLVSI